MNYIVTISINLFCFKQKIQIFQDNNCINFIEIPVDNINSIIEELCNKYTIDKIIFVNNNYLSRKIMENLTKYLEDKEIHIKIS